MKALLMLMFLFPQQKDTLTLQYCYEQVYETYPTRQQEQLVESSSRLKVDNLGVNYLPKITLSGKASYQSDVPHLETSSPLFTFPQQSKDQYKLLLDVTQTVYDGGITGSLEDIQRNEALAEQQKVEVELYNLKQNINDLYFGVLTLQESQKQLEIQYETVKEQLDQVIVQIQNGAVAGSNRYILEAQLVSIEQQIMNIQSNKMASIRMLSQLMDEDLDTNTVFKVPQVSLPNTDIKPGDRPEYKLYNLEKNTLTSYQDKISTNMMPKINVFGQAGYGRPGLNFLDNDFKSFYMVGLNLSWSPVNWGTNNNEEQIYNINKKMIDTRKETLDKNIKMSLEKYKTDISNMEGLIQKDYEIIALKDKVMLSISSQLQNGTITATDYLTELNSRTQAVINLKTHEVQLIQAKVNFLTAKGN
ncbi:MAG: TolC family protein [Ignavibacteriae bacterium]|nr:TolC family protein [Ignavibacteriota bacterium]MCB9244232.1 TolC family protein [Ignavibacteriales bacterium]